MMTTRGPTSGNYTIKGGSDQKSPVCFRNMFSEGTPWQLQNPTVHVVPILVQELLFVMLIIRLLMVLCKPLHQPRFVAELTACLLLGFSASGNLPFWMVKSHHWLVKLFPVENSMSLETFARMGITYYMFLVGLEMDLSAIKHIKKKSFCIAFAGTLIPLGIGASFHFIPVNKLNIEPNANMDAVFWSITLTVSSFPDLARILSDFKLLHSEIGKTALTAAIINDISVWFLLVLVLTIFHKYRHTKIEPLEALVALPVELLPIICFVLFCCFVLRPGIEWMIRRTKRKSGRFTESHIIFVLIGVAICGFVTDACGVHSLIGGFLFGLIIPSGEFAIIIMERTEEFVTGIWMPSFVIISGLKINLAALVQGANLYLTLLIIVVATSAKIISTVLVCLFFGMPLRDGISLGSLMNIKGFMALIILNEAWSLKVIDSISMVVMVVTILSMTILVGPIFFLANKTAKITRKYKQRTIQRTNPDSELRILTCIHSVGNLSGIINLLEVSNATRKSPISVFAVHLVELTRRSAMLIVHDTFRSSNSKDGSRESLDSEYIIAAFRNYQSRNHKVTVQPLTAVSSFSSIHDHIIEIAEDKVVAVILVPFHKQPTADGELQRDNQSIREVNQNLLDKAPCSVAILVDRGIGSANMLDSSILVRNGLKFAMLFFGGPDDREALSYAWRMAGKPGVSLVVVRFLPNKIAGQHGIELEDEVISEDGIPPDITKIETENELDDEFINEFRFKSMYDQSINYNEKMVNNSEEIVEFLKKFYNEFDLYIVGRGENVKSPLTMGLEEWGNDPELGAMGDTLVTSNFAEQASVLVVQQSPSGGFRSGSQRLKRKFVQKKWASPVLNPDYDAFVKKDY